MKRVFWERLADHVLQNLLAYVTTQFWRLKKLLKASDAAADLAHFAKIFFEVADDVRGSI